MKIQTKFLVLLCVSMQVFASNIPGAFAMKKPCATCGPLVHVFEKIVKDRYIDEHPGCEFKKNEITDTLPVNITEAISLLAVDISFPTIDQNPSFAVGANKKGEIVFTDFTEYKKYKKYLDKSEIKALLKNVSSDEPSVIIYAELKASFSQLDIESTITNSDIL